MVLVNCLARLTLMQNQYMWTQNDNHTQLVWSTKWRTH